MKEEFVSYEIARKMRECGFDWKVNNGYSVKLRLEPEVSHGEPKEVHSKDSKNFNDNRKGIVKGIQFYSAPSLSLVQKWLREVKKIDVLVFNCACGYGWEISKADPQSRGMTIALFDDNGEDEASGMWLSYESALSAGITQALTLLTENQ